MISGHELFAGLKVLLGVEELAALDCAASN